MNCATRTLQRCCAQSWPHYARWCADDIAALWVCKKLTNAVHTQAARGGTFNTERGVPIKTTVIVTRCRPPPQQCADKRSANQESSRHMGSVLCTLAVQPRVSFGPPAPPLQRQCLTVQPPPEGLRRHPSHARATSLANPRDVPARDAGEHSGRPD